MNAPLRGAEPDRQRYRGWIIRWDRDAWFAFPDDPEDRAGLLFDTVPEAKTFIDGLDEDEDGDPNEPDEGPAVIYSAEEEMAFIAEAERREMYAREEYEEDE